MVITICAVTAKTSSCHISVTESHKEYEIFILFSELMNCILLYLTKFMNRMSKLCIGDQEIVNDGTQNWNPNGRSYQNKISWWIGHSSRAF